MKFLKELHEGLSYRLRPILLDDMSTVVNDHHLEFALHMSDCKVLVHSFISRKQQLLWHLHFQKGIG